jgi:hypothetical protein
MAVPLTEEQKQIKKQQDDLRRRQREINFPTNVQIGQEVPLMPISKTPETLESAEQLAQKGFKSELQQPTQQLAKRILETPSVINKEAELGKFDLERSQALEEFRRSTGGIAGSSERNEELLKRFASGAFDRAQLGASLDRQRREDEIAAFDVGQRAIQQDQAMFSDRISNLLKTAKTAAEFAEIASRERIQLNDQQFEAAQNELRREHEQAIQKNDIIASRENLQRELDFREKQAMLGREFTAEQSALDRTLKESLAYLDINGQKEIISLQDKLSTDRLLLDQDFTEVQAALDRAMEISLQENNIQAQRELQRSQNEFNNLMQINQQKWETAERNANQIWRSNERLSEQDHQKAIQYLDFKNQEALQTNDINAQNSIQEMKSKLALKMQTQEMDQQEKMMFLDAKLRESAASEDFARQKTLLQLQTLEEMKILQQQGKQAESLALVESNLQKSLNEQNFDHTKILQEMKFNQETKLQLNELQLQEAELALKGKGINLQIDAMYNEWIQQASQSGQVSPESVYNWLQSKLPDNIKGAIKPPDEFAVQNAIKEDYLNMQLQYAMTHEGSAVYENGVFVGLTDEALTNFNEWFNSNFYNDENRKNEIIQKIYVNSKQKESGPKGPGPERGPMQQSNEKGPGMEV